MSETKHVLREEKYEPLFAERISDNFDENLAVDEAGMRQGIRETAEILINEEKAEAGEE